MWTRWDAQEKMVVVFVYLVLEKTRIGIPLATDP